MPRQPPYDIDDLLELRGRISAVRAEHLFGVRAGAILLVWQKALRRGEIKRFPKGRDRTPKGTRKPELFPERNRKIIALHEAGFSSRAIARRLELKSRNVVLGVVQRRQRREAKKAQKARQLAEDTGRPVEDVYAEMGVS